MAQSFLITLREGIEAALIVGIILAFLARTNNGEQFPKVWWGTVAAVIVSIVAGGVIFVVAGEFSGQGEEIFEGLAMLTAVAVLSYMVIWMKHQATNIRAHLEAQVTAAISGGSALALGLLAFVAVAREGLETALFMFTAVRTSSPLESALGGILGLALAVALGYLLFKGSHRLNLRVFFNVTGVLLILFAAGLLARGIHELQEAGAFPILIEHIWDINNVLNEKEGMGSFLKALFGYNGNPELIEALAYVAYLVTALTYFFRIPRLAASQAEERA
ncbi:MAG: FTR1 family protein [Chloroflexi bacterium]|nr:FTR1 family protein [Chloroflexota bacterium]